MQNEEPVMQTARKLSVNESMQKIVCVCSCELFKIYENPKSGGLRMKCSNCGLEF